MFKVTEDGIIEDKPLVLTLSDIKVLLSDLAIRQPIRPPACNDVVNTHQYLSAMLGGFRIHGERDEVLVEASDDE